MSVLRQILGFVGTLVAIGVVVYFVRAPLFELLGFVWPLVGIGVVVYLVIWWRNRKAWGRKAHLWAGVINFTGIVTAAFFGLVTYSLIAGGGLCPNGPCKRPPPYYDALRQCQTYTATNFNCHQDAGVHEFVRTPLLEGDQEAWQGKVNCFANKTVALPSDGTIKWGQDIAVPLVSQCTYIFDCTARKRKQGWDVQMSKVELFIRLDGRKTLKQCFQ